MPVSIDLRRKVEEATRLIDLGRESYGTLAERFGVPKATVYRWHFERLSKEVEGRKREIKELDEGLKKLREDFGSLESRHIEKRTELETAYEKRRGELEDAIEKLRQERNEVKEAFEKRGVTWEQGVQIVKGVSDLRGETSKLQSELSELKANVSIWEEEANQARSSSLQLKEQLSNLRGIIKREEGEFNRLMDRIISAQNSLHAIKDEERELRETVKMFKGIILVHELENRKASLQADVERLTGEIGKLGASAEQSRVNAERLTEGVKRLEAERGRLQLEREERVKKAKELAERIVTDAEQERKRLLAGVEKERGKILGEIGVLREEKQKLEAEKAFVEAAVRMRIEELRKARKPSEVEEAERDAEPLRLYLPKLPPLKERETKGNV